MQNESWENVSNKIKFYHLLRDYSFLKLEHLINSVLNFDLTGISKEKNMSFLRNGGKYTKHN